MVFNLSEHLKTPLQRRLYRVFGPALEKSLGLKGFNEVYESSARLFRDHPQHPSVFAWFDSVAQVIQTRE